MIVLWSGLLGAAFVFCYAGVLGTLAVQWWGNDAYSYGFLIPGISAYLAWTRRERLRGIPVRPSLAAGGSVLIVGFTMLILGHTAGVAAAEELSLVFVLSGAVILVLGVGYFRELLFPIAYLLFMIPAWGVLTSRLHAPLQLLSASIGMSLIQVIGVPAFREGTLLHFPNITLEVAQVCSGANYLIAVIAIGLPLAYLSLRKLRSRVILLAFGVVVAVLSNSLRVALIGVLSYLKIGGDIHGPFHVLQGMFVAVVGYVALFAGAWALSRTERGRAVPPATGTHNARAAVLSSPLSVTGPAIFLCSTLLLSGGYVTLYRPTPTALKKGLSEFPQSFGGWVGQDAAPDDSLYGAFNADDSLLRTYRRGPGEVVHLYIGYDAMQWQGKELVNEKTGPLHHDATIRPVSIGAGTSLPVRQALRHVHATNRLILFWYDVNGRITADRYTAKLYTAWDGIRHGMRNGAVVLVAADFDSGPDSAQAGVTAEAFVREVYPLTRLYLPAVGSGTP